MRPTYARINSEALIHNLKAVRARAPKSKLLAMAKANAYGHGASRLMNAWEFADALGVCSVEEALELRAAGFQKPIALVEGFFSADELVTIEREKLQIVVHQQQQIDALIKTKFKNPITVWLKLNTGMNRLGFKPEAFKSAYQDLINHLSLVEPPILMTHFACADSLDGPETKAQIELFQKTIQGLPGKQSLANSAGILAWPETHADWVRPGILLYGISPFDNDCGLDHQLQPVMTLGSEVIAINELKKDESVGYGHTWHAPENMKIAVIGIGYGDGYPRHARTGTPVLINGKRTSIVGRVSMDMITVDLRKMDNVKIGDPVVLWGEGLPIEEIARMSDTIGYELACHITNRVRRVYS